MSRLTAIGIGCACLVLAADQASKYWILHVLDLPSLGSIALLPVLNLTFVENRGVTFGLLANFGALGAPLLATIALAVVVALASWLLHATSLRVAIALGAIAGGAVGNVIDRLRYGWVVDFIHAHAFGWNWYVFNVADASIVCGVAALVLDSFLERKNFSTQLNADERR